VPIYVYCCPDGHQNELLQPLGAVPPESCACGAGPLERVLKPPAIRYHGTGFYSTDYGKSRPRP
jgi:putative FmdB family regulatory protein